MLQTFSVLVLRLAMCCFKQKENVLPDNKTSKRTLMTPMDSELGTGSQTVTTPIDSLPRTSLTEETDKVFLSQNQKPKQSCGEKLAFFFHRKSAQNCFRPTTNNKSNFRKFYKILVKVKHFINCSKKN
jgi:hypothetical protein